MLGGVDNRIIDRVEAVDTFGIECGSAALVQNLWECPEALGTRDHDVRLP
jgi:hypothetical protein